MELMMQISSPSRLEASHDGKLVHCKFILLPPLIFIHLGEGRAKFLV